MRKSWQFIGLLVINCLVWAMPAAALPEIKPGFPRLANYFLHWTISEQEARELAKFDLVILDAEAQERSRAELKLLRQLNPRIILLAYVPASEIRRDVETLAQIAPLRHKLGGSVPDWWYLKDASGARQSFWQGTWIVDVTGPSPQPSPAGRGGLLGASSPVGRGGLRSSPLPLGEGQGEGRWNEYLPQFVAREILSTGLWDGVFYDNAWDDIVHFARGVPDINRDGIADEPDAARRAWQDGLRKIYRKTAELAPNYFVFENDGPMYAPEVHGVLLESFPRKGWERHRQELLRVRNEGRDPAVAILNANTFNTGRRDDFRAMRYGLTTAMLHDAFYSFDFGDQDHGQAWFYDEYGVFLGEPLGPSPALTPTLSRGERGIEAGRGGLNASPLPWGEGGRRPGEGVWKRDFEQGIVLVNPSDAAQEVALAVEVEKIRGSQDTTTNNGAIVRELTVGGKDGLIVLRPLQIILGAAYENGVFARVFNPRGEPTRAGFFAFDRRETSGTVVAVVDMDGDGKDEHIRLSKVKGQRSNVEIRFGDGRKNKWEPFPGFEGEVNFDIGDVNRDGVLEIVAAMGTPHPSPQPSPAGRGELKRGEGELKVATQIRVFRPNGTPIVFPFFPFGQNYRGGANVAVGDLNGDGFSEIVVGAGPGGGPQVRIFSGEGRLLSGGFFAYDPRFRGGVRVAVGDTDGDGSAEIVTGPGPGGGPQVRLFDGKGRALSPGFFAFDRSSRSGAVPIVADIDGDGRPEILAVTREVL